MPPWGKLACVSKPIIIQARDALAAGVRLKDYDIEGLLGVGGFGLVYRAREDALQREVAIKEYLPSSMASRGADGNITLRSPEYQEPFDLGMRSFINEARLLARFDHPALVRVIRFWEARGTAYMVMPCYDGPTLYEARRAMPAPPTEAWINALMEPLLGALECLHREQVYHRDVAPDNILLIDDQDAPTGLRPVLLDFGAARRVISDHTQALTAILKPSFAPIEQYAETTLLRQGPWTDLYGLAAVLHYCITGRTPVPATARAVHDDLPRLSQMASAFEQDFGRSYSPALLATIDKALSVKPEDRPASVAAWRESLQAPLSTVLAPFAPLIDEGSEGFKASQDIARTEPAVARAVWNERTVVVSPPGLPQAPPSSFAATLPLRAVVPTTVNDESRFGASLHWPRPLVWGLGAVALASVVGLSAWSVKRDRQDNLSANAPAVATAPLAAAAGTKPSQLRPVTASSADAGEVIEEVETTAHRASQPALSQASDAVSEAQRKREARAQARKAKAEARAEAKADASAAALNPRQACGGRMFIAMAFCMKRYCSNPRYTQHAECVHMRAQERAQRENQRGYP